MLITKIVRLKNFGIFHDFSWKTELSEFKKFNLIYGWNRSGKTTISRIFASCEKKCVYDMLKFKQYPEGGEFEIKMSDNAALKNADVTTNALPVKIFNQDFIDDNISFDPANSCNPIVYVSEEDIESKKQLERLKANEIIISKLFDEAKKNRVAKDEAKGSFLIGLGREIANMLFDKSYNRTKAENKINTVGVDNFTDKILSDDDKKKYDEISKSEEGKEQNQFPRFQFSFLFDGETVDSFKKIFEIVQKLLSKRIVSETLDRLKDDQSLSVWVKQGFDLHNAKKENGKCLFCQKQLDGDLLTSLSKHFSADYDDLQGAIVELKSKVIKLNIEKISFPNNDLYPDLRGDYTEQAKILNDIGNRCKAWLFTAMEKVNEKYNDPFIVVSSLEEPEDFLAIFNAAVDTLNAIVVRHNDKVKNHPAEVKNAREKLELHSVAVALSQQDYKKFGKELKEAEDQEKNALEAVKKNSAEISELEKKTSNIGKEIKKINKHLKEFFGREEIMLELDSAKKGYVIKREGQPAKNLSEGEKTAIAFSYFIVKVEEKDFKIKDGIIFIDDPISSFDSNSIYHCFSLISTHFKDAGQLFISTHNFQLFNLTKEWFINKNNSIKKDNEKLKANGQVEKLIPCEFFMVENFIESNVRAARIVELDKTLRNYKSEYHFLFARLKCFSVMQEQEYADFYTIGNMARRFFDIFADFKIPNTGDQKSKMDVLIRDINEKGEKISSVDAAKAYKLVNEFSHNSDPTSTIEHKDKSESRDAINILLNIVKESDQKHYEILEKNLI